LRVVFAGTPAFAARALAALHEAGHDVRLVLTRPDRPAGRGLKLKASAVADWAAARGLPVFKPGSLRIPEALIPIREASPEVVVVAAYGLLLPAALLSIPALGCLNIHASLLPRWRGAAPIQRAILAGDSRTGISIMRMDEGLDTGPVLLQEALSIGERETAGSLTETLAEVGSRAIVAVLADLPRLVPQPQQPEFAVHAPKIAKGEALIDWRQSAAEVDRQIRAFDPAPGAETTLGGQVLKLWQARPVEGAGRPGEVLYSRNSRLAVACGEGALEILCLQRAGSRRLTAADFLRGTPLEPGTPLGDKPLAST